MALFLVILLALGAVLMVGGLLTSYDGMALSGASLFMVALIGIMVHQVILMTSPLQANSDQVLVVQDGDLVKEVAKGDKYAKDSVDSWSYLPKEGAATWKVAVTDQAGRSWKVRAEGAWLPDGKKVAAWAQSEKIPMNLLEKTLATAAENYVTTRVQTAVENLRGPATRESISKAVRAAVNDPETGKPFTLSVGPIKASK